MATSQFACVFFVVIEVFIVQPTVFISYQPVSLYSFGIKLDLKFYIFGNSK